MMRRSGFGSQLRPTVNVRSELGYVFHRSEKKLDRSFGSYIHDASAFEDPVTQRLAIFCSLFITPVWQLKSPA